MKKDVKVSILCMVYNHEKFLRKCLDSLVSQETNFSYEILIHDDASTDSSKTIIEEFYQNYPDKIVPVFEKENQYSQGKNINAKIMFPMSKGKYIAFCEGDDCWCDVNKLQKQFDFMEKNKDFSMCVHNTIIHDLSNKNKDKLFNDWNEFKELTEEDVFLGWKIHTTSYFIRRKFCELPEFSQKYWFGDFIRITIAYSQGKIAYLPEVMSIYNYNNPNGIVKRIYSKKDIEKIKLKKDYLLEYNEYTNYKYESIIKRRLKYTEYEIIVEMLKSSGNYNEFKKNRCILKSCEYYLEDISKYKIIDKIKLYLKYENYFSFKIINFLKTKI